MFGVCSTNYIDLTRRWILRQRNRLRRYPFFWYDSVILKLCTPVGFLIMNFSSFRLVDFIRLFDWIRLPQETDASEPYCLFSFEKDGHFLCTGIFTDSLKRSAIFRVFLLN